MRRRALQETKKQQPIRLIRTQAVSAEDIAKMVAEGYHFVVGFQPKHSLQGTAGMRRQVTRHPIMRGY